jgi:hypothetical protein
MERNQGLSGYEKVKYIVTLLSNNWEEEGSFDLDNNLVTIGEVIEF